MSTDLTDADNTAIIEAVWQAERDGGERELIYRAGLAAGRARAIEESASFVEGLLDSHAPEIADAIRSLLNAPAASADG